MSPVRWSCRTRRSMRRRPGCGTTWRRSPRGSACPSSRRATGFPPCSGWARAACRSFSCGSIRRATCRSGSRPPGFRSPGLAGRARAGWCIRRSPGRGRCRCRSPNCRMARRICALPPRWRSRWCGGGSRGRSTSWRWGARLANAGEVVYADGLDLDRARVGIGLSCRLCDRPDCGSRAFPPLEHRLSLDPLTAGASPYRFEAKAR